MHVTSAHKLGAFGVLLADDLEHVSGDPSSSAAALWQVQLKATL